MASCIAPEVPQVAKRLTWVPPVFTLPPNGFALNPLNGALESCGLLEMVLYRGLSWAADGDRVGPGLSRVILLLHRVSFQ
jgi:hypothetical protein